MINGSAFALVHLLKQVFQKSVVRLRGSRARGKRNSLHTPLMNADKNIDKPLSASFGLQTQHREQLPSSSCVTQKFIPSSMLWPVSKISTLLIYYAGSLALFLAFSIFRLMQLFPCVQWILLELMDKISTVKLPQEDYWQSLFSRPMFDSMRSSILLELQKSVQVGKLAPDSQVFAVDGQSRYKLLDFCRGSRPLVVNFCSWSCPVFRARAREFLSIVREFSDVVDFLTVYVEEAHPCDGWAFKVSWKKHS